MNNRRDWMGALRNRALANTMLLLALALFGFLLWSKW
jgi:hypothetical protein